MTVSRLYEILLIVFIIGEALATESLIKSIKKNESVFWSAFIFFLCGSFSLICIGGMLLTVVEKITLG